MKRYTWWYLAPLGVALVFAACRTTPPKPLVVPDSETAVMNDARYSNETFAALLVKYAPDGTQVDYDAWLAAPEDLAALDRQVKLLAAVSPDNRPEQFADRAAVRSYWINTYNTLVIHAVLQFWPLDSVKDVKLSLGSFIIPGKGFFYDHEVVVGGEKTNLYDLEKKILRSEQDPRLHFALNCASSSCPVLRPWEWSEAQLQQAAQAFINDPANVAVRDRTLYLSRIFKWYKADFGDDIQGYLLQYAGDELAGQLRTAKAERYPIEYVKYDWGLNAAAPAAGDGH